MRPGAIRDSLANIGTQYIETRADLMFNHDLPTIVLACLPHVSNPKKGRHTHDRLLESVSPRFSGYISKANITLPCTLRKLRRALYCRPTSFDV